MTGESRSVRRRASPNRHRFDWESEAKPPSTKGVPNGRLCISLQSRWHGARCNWSEGRQTLEQQLPSLFAELERRAAEDDERAEERRRDEIARQHAEQERYERAQRTRIEQARVSRLSNGIASWRLAQEAHEYVAALRARLPELASADRERVSAWCDWIDAWRERADPTVNVSQIHGLDDEADRFYVPPR